jgi:hypothetical protein
MIRKVLVWLYTFSNDVRSLSFPHIDKLFRTGLLVSSFLKMLIISFGNEKARFRLITSIANLNVEIVNVYAGISPLHTQMKRINLATLNDWCSPSRCSFYTNLFVV